ncbi:MAG: threonine synthase [Acidobacteriota bacterium]
MAGVFLSDLGCSRCGRSRPFAAPPATLCGCGSPLLARYRIDELRAALPREAVASRRADLWRYAELLPGVPPVTLGEGFTPLVPADRLGADLGLRRLFVKDESLNPTGSFKARGMSVAVSVAAAQGAQVLAAPSAGNAGTALAAYAARAGLEARLFLPETTPRPCVEQARRHGAGVTLVPGSIADAASVMREAMSSRRRDWLDLSTLREPFRIEGKKTMGLEIAEQLGFELPDVIVYPTGGGTGLIGMWKAFDEMEALGWIGPGRPRMVAVQASGCAPIVRAFSRRLPTAEPWRDPTTVAAGLRVPSSLGDFLMLRILRESRGTALAVDDREMMEGAARLGSREGIDACPEGGATIAALEALRGSAAIGADDTVVVFNTGTALKYSE